MDNSAMIPCNNCTFPLLKKDIRGYLGGTRITRASFLGHHHCLNVLLQAGVSDVNARTDLSHCALHLACSEDHHKCVELLIEAGADVNQTSVDGTTPLIACTMSGSRKSAKLLLKAGAHVNKKNSNGYNALEHYLTENASVSKQLSLLLFAAGEILDTEVIQSSMYGFVNIIRVEVPEFLKNSELKLCLKHLCRETIRKHLVQINPHVHLFSRVPQLGLPSVLASYLLYDMSLEERDSDEYGKFLFDQVELRRRKFLPWSSLT